MKNKKKSPKYCQSIMISSYEQWSKFHVNTLSSVIVSYKKVPHEKFAYSKKMDKMQSVKEKY